MNKYKIIEKFKFSMFFCIELKLSSIDSVFGLWHASNLIISHWIWRNYHLSISRFSGSIWLEFIYFMFPKNKVCLKTWYFNIILFLLVLLLYYSTRFSNTDYCNDKPMLLLQSTSLSISSSSKNLSWA